MHSTATIDQCDTSTTADWRIFVKLKRNTVNAYIYMFCSVRLAGHNNQVNSNSVFLSYPTSVFKNDSLQNQHNPKTAKM